MSARRVEDIWHEAQEPTPTPEYVEGALYRVTVYLAPDIVLPEIWDGWAFQPGRYLPRWGSRPRSVTGRTGLQLRDRPSWERATSRSRFGA